MESQEKKGLQATASNRKVLGVVLRASGSQALFLEVITEKTDQHCSTFLPPQRGQTT
jgi:hypothetical protein